MAVSRVSTHDEITRQTRALPGGRLRDVFAIDLRTLATTRIALSVVLLGNLATRAVDLRAMYTDNGLLPRAVLRDYHQSAGDWYWSLHALGGSTAFQAMMFVIAGLFALALLVGYRTRCATIGSWILLVSLHNRMPLLVTGGDVLLSMLLFWGIFLPWGKCWSVDVASRSRKRSAPQRSAPQRRPTDVVCSPASAAILLQVALMYLLTGIGKWNEIWLSGEAIHNALSYDMIARPLGRQLLEYPDLLKWLTWGTLGLELAAPFLLFSPWGTRCTRPLALISLVALHLGIEFTMRVTVFSFASIAGLTLFLTPWFWRLDWVRRRIAHGSPHDAKIGDVGGGGGGNVGRGDHPVPTNRLLHAVVLLLLICVFVYNIGWQSGGAGFLKHVPKILRRVAESGGFAQRWTMFVRPDATDYRFAAVARLKNGDVVDVWRDGMPFDLNKADSWPSKMPSQRWMLAFRELSEDRANWFRQSAAEYLYRRWNGQHDEQRQIELLDLLLVQVKPWMPGVAGPPMVRLGRVDSLAQGPFRNGKRHGEWVLRHADGEPASRGPYENGKRQGEWTFFHENGRIAAEGPYRDDVEHGHWVHHYGDGAKEAEGEYRDGKMQGRWTFWYEDGSHLESMYENGRPAPTLPGAKSFGR